MVFAKYAKYYDLLYREKDYKKEVAFMLEALKRGGFSGKKILSLGCGTCTYEIILAQKGFSITGVDVSKQMLKIAKDKVSKLKLTKNIKLIQGDVRDLNLSGKFDIVMCMFNVIGYQNTNEDLSKMLKNVSHLLKKNGAFFFDCWHMPAVFTDKPTKRVKKIVINGETIVRKTIPILFPEKNLLQITFDIKNYKGKKLMSRANETHIMRYFSLPELTYFLETNGIKIQNTCNFLDINSKIGSDKWDIFVIACKN